MKKTLFIISKGMNKPPDNEIRERERMDLQPRVKLLEDMISAEVLDERFLETQVPAIRRFFYRLIPCFLAQIVEAFIIHKRYSAILSFYEKVGLPLVFLQKLTRSRTPHIFLSSWLSSSEKAWFLRRVHPMLTKIILWSSVQYKFALEKIGIPEKKLKLTKYGVDQKFWRPIDCEQTIISSAGMEMRDYSTLIDAVRPLNIPCHIATGTARGELFDTVKQLYRIDNLPEHITVEKKSFYELRRMYAESKFVVVPLLKTDTDNGITVMLEAMAMGKTVICSEVEGQRDLLQHGINGIFVRQGDSEALRAAILELWNNPERCRKMGEAARKHVLQYHAIEKFFQSIAEEVVPVKSDMNQIKPEQFYEYDEVP